MFLLRELKLLPDSENLSETKNKMLQGSALQLLGLLVWGIQKEEEANGKMSALTLELENSQREIAELKNLRSEDAKANEKVVGIYAAQEQCWFDERKKLKQHIGALMHELRAIGTKKDKAISELKSDLQSKDRTLEEEVLKSQILEEKLRKAESVAEDLRSIAMAEAQKHASEITKHKTASVSSQRQLEAAKEELDSVLKQKEESLSIAQKLSMDIVKLRKELEQKDSILSAMLRKSKLDTAEKQMLLKEVKLSKSKRKQAELETERWKLLSESRHDKLSLRNLLSKHGKNEIPMGKAMFKDDEIMPSNSGKKRSQKIDYLFSSAIDNYLTEEGNQKPKADVENMTKWVRSEVGKCKIAFDEKRQLEIDAFAEQLRAKDEKLEAFRWRLLSMEVESKRIRSHFTAMDQEVAQLKQENKRLESLLSNREAEIDSLNERLNASRDAPDFQEPILKHCPQDQQDIINDTVWSKVKIIKRKPGDKDGTEESEATNPAKDIILTLKYPVNEAQEGAIATKTNPAWKMNLHALGVSCKIKMLKQKLHMLERLTGKQARCETNDNVHFTMQGFYAFMSILNKQVSRYDSLQGKIDDLCRRMHENNVDETRTREQMKMLERFLEETFQMQRYMVATGQKLMDIQTKVGAVFVGTFKEVYRPDSFDMKRFADNIRTLFKEIQRGIEVRIARIIGDLEGTLACEGIRT